MVKNIKREVRMLNPLDSKVCLLLGAQMKTNMTALDAVIVNSISLGTGRRCFSFHLLKAELVVVGRGNLNNAATFQPRNLRYGFLRILSSRSSTDDSLPLEDIETLSALFVFLLWCSLAVYCTDCEDIVEETESIEDRE